MFSKEVPHVKSISILYIALGARGISSEELSVEDKVRSYLEVLL